MRINIFTEPTMQDPAHLILYSVPEIGAAFSGGRIEYFLIKLLAFFIKRRIKKGHETRCANG